MAAATVGLAWLAVFIKAPGAWRRHAPAARRALWVALFALALGWSLRVPSGYRQFDAATGVPNLSQLFGDVFALITACAILGMLLYQTNEPSQARRKLRARVTVLGVTIPVMALTFSLAPVEQETADFLQSYAHQPLIAVYVLAYLGFVGYAFCDLARITRAFALASDRWSLSAGMRCIEAAGVLGVGYVVLRLSYLIAVWVGVASGLAAYGAVSRTLVAALSLVAVTGAVLPAAADRVQIYRAYRQLHPLWVALYRSTPGIALSPPSKVREVAGLFSARQLRFALRSRIIEIRDGRFALRSYFRRDVAERARRLSRRDGLTGEDLAATVEARRSPLQWRTKHRGGRSPRTPLLTTRLRALPI